MIEVEVAYQGQLRCNAVHGPSSCELVTDAPTDNQGRGESFSPTDLVATALGSCALTIMGIVADRHGWDLSGVSLLVEKHMVADPLRRIGKLVVRVQGAGSFDAQQRQALEKAAFSCPVNQSLGERVVREFHFDWAG
jgi:uncharacterized OsmC-like protein